MLNPELDRQVYRKEFAIDGRIRIDNFLDEEISERIRQYCLEENPFDLTYFADGQNRVSTQAEIAKMTQNEKGEFGKKIRSAASQGIGFMYGSYRMKTAQSNGNEKLVFLGEVFEYFNSEAMLEFIREVSGAEDILSADAQLTRYTTGQFLTRHRDVVEGRDRRLAYVLGFTREWHPDWGGLLQFYEEDGTPREAWTPRFNSLALFDIRHIHSVTFVTPFALEPRLSLAGWFRTSPKV